MKLITLFLLGPHFALAAKSLAGFNYGAFWGNPANSKTKADFLDGFNMAKNLSTDISFNNARLFSCITANTENEPTGAFDAAVESKTSLLLGFWITPGKRTDSNEKLIDNEMLALEKGFQRHGQALADLILGLSVGNEDIYRFVNTAESGVAADGVAQTIDNVKKRIAASSFAKYMKDKPIGHIDTAQHAVVDNADFIGMTAYPYWTNESIDKAKDSFLRTLEGVKQKAGNRPVWVAEVGWPFNGPQRGDAVASAENLQRYWTEVGCALFGNYPTFWFELVTDSTHDQPDWGLIDIPSRQPRIKELKCPKEFPSAVPSPPASSSQAVLPLPPASKPLAGSTTLATLPSSSAAPPSQKPKSTVHIKTTQYVTVQPGASASTAPNDDLATATVTLYVTVKATVQSTTLVPRLQSSPIPSDRPWCVTVADIDGNGQHVTIAGNLAGPDGACKAPPSYNGYPYASNPASKPTPVPIGTPWCVTMADIDHNSRLVAVDAGPAGSDGNCRSLPEWTWPTASPSAAPSALPPLPASQVVAVPSTPLPPLPASQVAAVPSSPLPPLPASQVPAIPSAPAPSPSPAPPAAPSSSSHPYCIAKSKRRAASLAVLSARHLPTPAPLQVSNPPSTTPLSAPTSATPINFSRRMEKRGWWDKMVNWFKHPKLWRRDEARVEKRNGEFGKQFLNWLKGLFGKKGGKR